MKKQKNNLFFNIEDANKMEYPIYFEYLTSIIKNEDKIVKVEIVESKIHQTKNHIPLVFYKPISRIFDEN